jgi:hypothetical protein
VSSFGRFDDLTFVQILSEVVVQGLEKSAVLCSMPAPGVHCGQRTSSHVLYRACYHNRFCSTYFLLNPTHVVTSISPTVTEPVVCLVSLWGSTGLPITQRPAQLRQSLLSGVDEVYLIDAAALVVVVVFAVAAAIPAQHILCSTALRSPRPLTFIRRQSSVSVSTELQLACSRLRSRRKSNAVRKSAAEATAHMPNENEQALEHENSGT